ncbi:SRPBCC domain-containing protein [Allonocardiopsis opalescens]|uniref:Uncharacterized protein YndB with AHSA1/START domain n=1 Tax=Allonocardiopsis opalescens TaxID=1144618 RepID=A0A2T0QEK3_9ACTN|nr:SRPBCC domain-containing protein [Allonocardiopsis opalescens]PRY02332.1 uncharacterized protein YndB with AHSA1/START domain [Allonocardiopsis opalescens]
MNESQARLTEADGIAQLRIERRLAHPVEKVWRVVTEPDELAHWFPAEVVYEPVVGSAVRFAFPGEEADPDDPNTRGELLEYDPPRRISFRWSDDVVTIELSPDGDGCLLVFRQDVGGGFLGRLAAGRAAAGWDTCLDALADRLAGREPAEPGDMLAAIERYVREFGIDRGESRAVDGGFELRFVRDLIWIPLDQAWSLLVEGAEPRVGGEPPLRAVNDTEAAGRVTAAEAPRVLEYEWTGADGTAAGRVRWEFGHDPAVGTHVVLTQTVPAHLAGLRAAALARWHIHLESFFAATRGVIRCPWPEDREAELTAFYAERLA